MLNTGNKLVEKLKQEPLSGLMADLAQLGVGKVIKINNENAVKIFRGERLSAFNDFIEQYIDVEDAPEKLAGYKAAGSVERPGARLFGVYTRSNCLDLVKAICISPGYKEINPEEMLIKISSTAAPRQYVEDIADVLQTLTNAPQELIDDSVAEIHTKKYLLDDEIKANRTNWSTNLSEKDKFLEITRMALGHRIGMTILANGSVQDLLDIKYNFIRNIISNTAEEIWHDRGDLKSKDDRRKFYKIVYHQCDEFERFCRDNATECKKDISLFEQAKNYAAKMM